MAIKLAVDKIMLHGLRSLEALDFKVMDGEEDREIKIYKRH